MSAFSSPHLLPVYRSFPASFVRGQGVWLYDEAGKAHLDFAAGLAVMSAGHNHPHLVAALREQAGKVWHTSNLYHHPLREKLAARLTGACFAGKVFFTNSGTEAVECALKMARGYHYKKGDKARTGILTFSGAFHGRTYAALSAAGKVEGFGAPLPGFKQLPFGDFAAVEAAADGQTAAILLEPIQGEGGVREAAADFLRRLRALCDQRGILLIFDEVQTGIGRCGTFLAHEEAGIAPDIAAIAKGLGGGFPAGACLAAEEAASGLGEGEHGSTFGGNILALAVMNAVLDIILAPGFLAGVRRRGLRLRQSLAMLAELHSDVVSGLRGRGLLQGLACRIPPRDLADACLAQGLLTAPAADGVLRLLPPLIASEDDIAAAAERLDAACVQLKKGKKGKSNA